MRLKILVLFFSLLVQISIYADEINYEGLWSSSSNAAKSKFDDIFSEDFLSISKIGDSFLVVLYDSEGINQHNGIAVPGVDSEGDNCLIIEDFGYSNGSGVYIKESIFKDNNYPSDWIDSLDMGDPNGDDWGPMYIFYRSGYSELHRIGTINDNNVRYRKFPTTEDYYKNKSNEILGKYNKGQELELLWRSDSKMKIGRMNDYWYMVKDVNDVPVNMTGWPYRYGWVYGAFLDIQE